MLLFLSAISGSQAAVYGHSKKLPLSFSATLSYFEIILDIKSLTILAMFHLIIHP